MKKLTLLILFALAIANVFGISGTFYWVGATGGSWATTTNWSSTTNGVYTAVAAVPTTADNVYFDGIKSTGTVGTPASTTYTDMSVALTAGTTITNMTVSSGGTITFTAAFTLIMSNSLTFSNNTKLSATPASNGQGFTLGTGSTFTLSGMNSTNFFDGNTNTYFNFNTSSPLTVYFNPSVSTAYGALGLTKGLITLGTNVNTSRVTFGSNGSNLTQGLALNGNQLTISGNGSSTFNLTSNCSAIDASVAGSKVIITSQNPSILYQGGNMFKSTIDYLELNSSGYIFTLFNPITVNTLKLTAGSINNIYNNITVNTAIIKNGANNGNLLTAPIYGGTINVTTSANSTSGNELLGITGKVGTLTVNDGFTYTLNGSGVTSYSLTNCGLGYATAPAITFNTPTNGTAATGTALVQGGAIVGIHINNPGIGYTSTPTIGIANAPASFNAWTSGTTYAVNNLVTSGGNLYICTTGGVAGATAPSTVTGGVGQNLSDGTDKWTFLTGPWAVSKGYVVGMTANNGGNLYLCISSNGSSASTGTGPSGTGSGIVDGTLLWKYIGSYSGTLSPVNATATATYNSSNSLTVDNLVVGNGVSGIVNYPNNPNALTLNVNNNVTVNAGATLAPVVQTSSVTHLLNVGGNVTNSGTFTTSVTNGKLDITMNGSATQSLPGLTLNNLILNNSAGASLTGAPTVNGILTLTSGKISLGANNLTIGASGSITGGSASSYIITDGTGKLNMPVAATTNVLIPIGSSASSYDPATVNAATSTTFAAKVSETLSGTAVYGVKYNPYEWTLVPTAGSNTTISLTPSSLDGKVSSNNSSPLIGIYNSGYTNYNSPAVTFNTGTYSGSFDLSTIPSPLVLVTGANIDVTGLNKSETEGLKVYSANNQLMISGLAAGDAIALYGLNGQLMKSFVASASQSATTLPQGGYVVKIRTAADTKVSKVIVN